MVAVGLAAATVAVTRRPKDALPILAAGVLVDLDHLVDYAYFHLWGRGRFIAPLHSWEYVLGLLASGRAGPKGKDGGQPEARAGGRLRRLLAGGLAAHLALDQVHAPRNPLAYWLLYRLRHGFRWEAMGFLPGLGEGWKQRPWWEWV